MAPVSLSSRDAAPMALSSPLAFTHRCSGAHAAPSPSCSEGSWSPRDPCSARMPGSTLQAGTDTWTQAGGNCLYPGWTASAESPPTSTHEVALVPRGLIVAIPALGAEGATIAGAADAEAGAAARAVTIASPIAAAGLPGPARTGCTGETSRLAQRAAARGAPPAPPAPAHPTVTHIGSLGRRCRAGSKASACPHTATGKSQGAAAAWGGEDTALSPLPSACAPCHPSVLVPKLTHGTTTAPRAPRFAPGVGDRRSLRRHRHPPALPADGSHCRDTSQCGV